MLLYSRHLKLGMSDIVVTDTTRYIQCINVDEMLLYSRHLKLGMSDIVVTETKEWVVKHPGQVVLTVVSDSQVAALILPV